MARCSAGLNSFGQASLWCPQAQAGGRGLEYRAGGNFNPPITHDLSINELRLQTSESFYLLE
jgi:hypothetical protein